ncbi:MAG: ArnT family glycosyltransferase [Anaerolineae bacterium]
MKTASGTVTRWYHQLQPYLAILALLAACLAQAALDRSAARYAWLAGGLFALAAVLMVVFTYQQRLEANASQPAHYKMVPAWRRMLAAFAIPAGIYAWLHLADNRFTCDGTLAWVIAIALLLIAAYQVPTRKHAKAAHALQLDWLQVAVIGAVVVGAFLRLWRLREIPAEMGCDLPLNFSNIQGILNGNTPIFFTSWPGREGLLFYLAAIPSALVGLSHWSIKLTTALLGIAAIPVIYWLGKELYTRELGLIAAWLYAASHWAVITSRLGLRMALAPLLLMLVALFFIRGVRCQNPWYLALAGLCLGLGLHSYNAFIAVPPLVILWLVIEVILGRGKLLWQQRFGLACLFGTALVVFLPLGRFIFDSPAQYLLRVATRVTNSEVALPGNLIRVFLHNIVNALLMFNVHGDLVSFNNIAGFRELGFVAAALLPVGLVRLVVRPKRGYNLLLLATLLVMLLPTALSLAFPNEVPGAGRAIGALPAAILISALSLELVRRAILPRAQPNAVETAPQPVGSRVSVFAPRQSGDPGKLPSRARRLVAWVLIGTALGAEAVAAYPLYFDAYRLNLPDQNYSISLEMARVMDDFAGNGQVFIKTQGYWYDGNAVRAQLVKLKGWNAEFWDLDPNQPPAAGPPGKVLIILHPKDTASITALRRVFPSSAVVAHYYYDGQEAFIAFYGER